MIWEWPWHKGTLGPGRAWARHPCPSPVAISLVAVGRVLRLQATQTVHVAWGPGLSVSAGLRLTSDQSRCSDHSEGAQTCVQGHIPTPTKG